MYLTRQAWLAPMPRLCIRALSFSTCVASPRAGLEGAVEPGFPNADGAFPKPATRELIA